jgi:hypothetical protein
MNSSQPRPEVNGAEKVGIGATVTTAPLLSDLR